MSFSPFNADDVPQTQPLDSWYQSSQYAPTPGNFGRTPTPSALSPSPDHIEGSSPSQPYQSDHLGFVPLAEWDEGRPYDEQPPTCIHYSIEWRVKLNNRTLPKDTEPDLVLAPSLYWRLFLKQKLENFVLRKTSRNRPVRSDDTTNSVCVNDRSQCDLNKRFESTDIDWTAVERQLLMWGNLFRLGKRLRLNITFFLTI
jgi:hypothetical protein